MLQRRLGLAGLLTALLIVQIVAPWSVTSSDDAATPASTPGPCAATPIQTGPWTGTGHGEGLAGIPWIPIAMGEVEATAHLFVPDRTAPVEDQLSAGSRFKVLWTFTVPVRGVSISATEASDPHTIHEDVVAINPTAGMNASSTEWPSTFTMPRAGCWRVAIQAATDDGVRHTGELTLVVAA